MIHAYSRAAVLVRGLDAGITKIETHQSVVERRCSMTPGGLIDILSAKQFYVWLFRQLDGKASEFAEIYDCFLSVLCSVMHQKTPLMTRHALQKAEVRPQPTVT